MQKLKLKITKSLLYKAFLQAKKHKRNKNIVLESELNLGQIIKELYQSLKNNNYKIKPYCVFKIYEKKERLIYAPHFKDCITQWLIYSQMYEFYKDSFSPYSQGLVKNRGLKSAIKLTQEHLKDDFNLILQVDINKYFASINHQILSEILRKNCDESLVKLCELFYLNDKKKGLGLGNLLSQLLALIYLNEFDDFLHKKNVKFVRYVDDYLIFLTLENKEQFRKNILIFLKNRLSLRVSKILYVKDQFSFLGFEFKKGNAFFGKRLKKALKRAYKKKDKAVIKGILNLLRL